jgi:ribosomal protein S30
MKGASALIVGHYSIQRPNEIIIKEKKSLTPRLMNHSKLYQKTIRVNQSGTVYNYYDTIRMTYLVNLT